MTALALKRLGTKAETHALVCERGQTQTRAAAQPGFIELCRNPQSLVPANDDPSLSVAWRRPGPFPPCAPAHLASVHLGAPVSETRIVYSACAPIAATAHCLHIARIPTSPSRSLPFSTATAGHRAGQRSDPPDFEISCGWCRLHVTAACYSCMLHAACCMLHVTAACDSGM